jgi:lipopolysaccharide biosynthesis regulator YciM
MNKELLQNSIIILKEHALTISVILITIVLLYHFFVDRHRGVRLSRRYRHSLFELQSKLLLNASQYLISGEKDKAIQELLNAAEANKEILDTYFALGKLFRSSGEIEKAINIHRSLIARETASENVRLSALKELAIDYDKGGFVDKAIETYKDVLKLNREQPEIIQSLCRIYEDIGDWDNALNFRQMLSKVGADNQSETLSHILVEKSKELMKLGKLKESMEKLEDAFRYAPSVSARIQKINLLLLLQDQSSARTWLLELLKEYPLYSSFIFITLEQNISDINFKKQYDSLKEYFISLQDEELWKDPSILISKVKMLKELGRSPDALNLFQEWLRHHPLQGEAMKMEYLQLLIDLNKKEELIPETSSFLQKLRASSTRHFCSQCGFNSDEVFWRCPQCHQWETIQFRWKI